MKWRFWMGVNPHTLFSTNVQSITGICIGYPRIRHSKWLSIFATCPSHTHPLFSEILDLPLPCLFKPAKLVLSTGMRSQALINTWASCLNIVRRPNMVRPKHQAIQLCKFKFCFQFQVINPGDRVDLTQWMYK